MNLTSDKSGVPGRQLAWLMAACLMADQFVCPTMQWQQPLTAQWAVLGFALQCLLIYALFWLTKNYGEGLNQCLIARVFLLGSLVISLAVELTQGQRFYETVQSSVLGMGAFLIVVFAVAFYGVYAGLGALSRTAFILVILSGVSLLFLAISLLEQLRFTNLQPDTLSIKPIWNGFIHQASLPAELLIWPLFAAKNKNKQGFFFGNVVLGLFAMGMFLAILGEMALGEVYFQQEQPVFTIARLGGISVFRRLDALHASVWLMLFLIKTTVYCFAAVQLMEGFNWKLSRHAPFFITVAAVLIVFVTQRKAVEPWLFFAQQAGLLTAGVSAAIWSAFHRKGGCKQ